jgi:MFS family permease
MTTPGPTPDQATRHVADSQADEVIDRYLAAVATGLTLAGPGRARRAILAELHDGLLEAVDTHRARGRTPAQAATAATTEFGDPGALAASFAPELSAVQARRTALALIRSGPMVGVLWATALASSHLATLPAHPAPPWQWPHAPTGLWVVFPLVALAVLVGVPAGLLAVAATGRLARWLPRRPRLAPTAAATIAIAVIAIDLTLLGMLTAWTIIAPDRLAWTPVTLAAAASLIRLLFGGRATRHCLVTRATLT